MWWISLLCLIVPIWGESPELVHVNMMFRHGARTPLINTYPTDPLKNYTYPPYGLGTLLKLGKIQGYEFGQQLRERYGNLLGEKYSSDVCQLYSDGSVRVQETALMAMAALWPPPKDEEFFELKWQPVTYQFREYYPDMDGSKTYLYEHVFDLPKFREEKLAPYNKSITFILEKSGFTLVKNITEVYSSTSSQTVLGIDPPEWTKTVFPEPLSTLTYIMHAASVYTPELRKDGCNLLTEWVSNIDRIVQQLEEPKAKFYAAHDNNIVPMLECLDIYTPPEPNYVANLASELYKNGTEYFVKIVYQRHHDKDVEVLTIPGCESLCPLNKFKAIVADRTSGVEPKLINKKV